jgi:hypothetical protein
MPHYGWGTKTEVGLQREPEYESDNQQKYAECYRGEQKFIHPKGMPERLFCSEHPNRGLWHRKLFDGELGNLRGVFNPQPANRNDLLGDELRDGVAAILQAQRPQSLLVSRHQTFNVLRLERNAL